MEKIISQIKEKIKSKYEEYLLKGNDFKAFEKYVKSSCDEMFLMVIKSFIEDLDNEIKLEEKRDKRYVVQREVDKLLTTTLGSFRYRRTKYYDKEEKRNRYLLDEKLEIPKYEHMTQLATARMLKIATETSYSNAGKEINGKDVFSKGMIYQKIKRLNVKEDYEEKVNKRKVKELYINLDEDHVALQKSDKKNIQCKIGYVYEGKIKECKGRYKLKKKHTICGTYLKSSGNSEFYEKINSYIRNNYDEKYLDKIIIYGDGAKWITSSEEYIDKSEFRLDKFHLMKSIMEAVKTVDHKKGTLKKNIERCIYEGNKEKLIDLFDDVVELSNKPEVIIKTKTYIINNWEAIQRTVLTIDGSGCSAEGNVSHILSARLSQKGMGWCEHNVDVIGKLRGIQANDGDEAFDKIVDTYYYQRTHKNNKKEIINYRYRANPKININKSYVDRIQATIPDYYMKRRILKKYDEYIKYE